MKKLTSISVFLFLGLYTNAQNGKDGALTVSSVSQVVNRYAPVLSNITAGSSTVSIPLGLISLSPGDLIMVYQAQGAMINTANSFGYGTVNNYGSAGFYEFKYVQNISGQILTCITSFTNAYAANGKTQVVKIPQYTNLTVNIGASIAPGIWRDTTINGSLYRFGGILGIHASNIINNGSLTASACGFRGGQPNNNTVFINGLSDYVTTLITDGGEKGEGIFGYKPEYDLNGGRYSRGAPANGGGGGSTTNAPGGGGANGFNGNIWTGQGVMVVNTANPLTAWSLDPSYLANNNSLCNSSGGGRGGYSWSDFEANALVDGPGNPAWGGDSRREVGGLGGRPLSNINAENRIYFGGGGGTGHQNQNGATPGGQGGGVVYLVTTGSISGSGKIEANGNNVIISSGCSCDGPGGGGGGGSIVIKCLQIAQTQTIQAMGGTGGSQLVPGPPASSTEAQGPGGGGGGGFVAISSAASNISVSGGQNGSSQGNGVSEFPFNGATEGASGQVGTVSRFFVSYEPVGITETLAQSHEHNIYPNPGSDGFVIELYEKSLIEIIDQLGQVVLQTDLPSGKQTVGLKHLTDGVYFVSIKNESELQLIKWIKQ